MRLVILTLWVLVVFGTGSLFFEERKAWLKGSEVRWLKNYPVASTGPLKGVLVASWWIKIQQLQMKYEFEKIAGLTEKICYLQPNIPEVWEYMGWNMAFNLLAETAHDRKSQIFWLEKGIHLMQDGLHYVDDQGLLCFYLGFTIYNKYKSEFDLKNELQEILGADPKRQAYDYLLRGTQSKKGKVEFWRHDFFLQVAAEIGESEMALKYLQKIRPDYEERESRMNQLQLYIQNYGK